ncbi:PTS sugar transporter subunit IIA [bacterium]|nr:PTS sugar transporter subunit IIA [bacterium]
MNLKDVLTPNRICLFKSNKKDESLMELIDVLKASCGIPDIQELKERIFYRENLMSTGIGLGIAIPHVRLESIHDLIMALGISPGGILDYTSIDDKPVKIIAMIAAGKDQHKYYIQLLSDLVSKLKSGDTINRLTENTDPNQIYQLLLGK